MIDAIEYWKEVIEDYFEATDYATDYGDKFKISDKDIRLMAIKILDNDELWDYIYSTIYEELQHYMVDIEEL